MKVVCYMNEIPILMYITYKYIVLVLLMGSFVYWLGSMLTYSVFIVLVHLSYIPLDSNYLWW